VVRILSERHVGKSKARTYVDIVRLELGEEHDAGGGRDQVLVGQNHTLHTVQSQYQCCGSGMFIPDPDFCFVHPGSRIQKQQQKRGVKKNVCPTFIYSHKNHKIENYINVELVKTKIWANYQRIIEHRTFYPKNCH
jgi:hypothetical protein